MSRSVTIASGQSNVQLPNGGVYQAGQSVLLTDEQFAKISPSLIPGTVVDNGYQGDGVTTQAAAVAAPAALTSVVAAGANPTKAEYDALRADVSALRTTVANLLTALKGTGKPMASS